MKTMKKITSNFFEKKYGLVAIVIIMIPISLWAFTWNYQNNPIVGTWIGIHKTSTQTRVVFTADEYKYYFKEKLMATYNYEITNKTNPCGADMSMRLELYPDDQFLILIDMNTNEKHCYLVYELTENRFIYSPFGSASVDSLKKVYQ